MAADLPDHASCSVCNTAFDARTHRRHTLACGHEYCMTCCQQFVDFATGCPMRCAPMELADLVKPGAVMDVLDPEATWYQASPTYARFQRQGVTETIAIDPDPEFYNKRCADGWVLTHVAVHFVGWQPKYDEWIDVAMRIIRFAPLGTYTQGPYVPKPRCATCGLRSTLPHPHASTWVASPIRGLYVRIA